MKTMLFAVGAMMSLSAFGVAYAGEGEGVGPNSQFTQLPWDYLHPNHAGYNAMGLTVNIAPFSPHGHGHH